MKLSVLFIFLILFSISSSSSSSSSLLIYNNEINSFLLDLQLQCPSLILSTPSIEMDGESVDGLLSSSKMNAYSAILFYSSWCPFSKTVQPKFEALASMYPQINHVKVEQSLTMPSVFSRHRILSVPSILIANRTSRAQYHGPKDLHSLLDFYQKTTGLEPVVFLTEEQLDSTSEDIPRALLSLYLTTLKNEPYLVFSVLFVLLKAFLFLCPNIVSSVIALWVAYIPRLNLAIFGESKQLLTHAIHFFGVKSAFSKLKLSKSRNFHKGARSARVLASSFASVSLGETSSARA